MQTGMCSLHCMGYTTRPFRTLHWVICLVFVEFLFTFAQGQGPGTNGISFTVNEESTPGTYVGKIQTQSSYTSFRFQDDQALFSLDTLSGNITTKVKIDRESLEQDTLNILVLGTLPSGLVDPIDIYITVLDINDNSPKFPKSEVTIKFGESSNIGDMNVLDTATDLDIGQNGNVTNYQIISRDDDGKFETVFDPANFGQNLRIRLIGNLDREERDKYQLNISVQDNGNPPKYGYLRVHINIQDVNDNPPVFAQSQFVASINESTPVGTTVIHVEANDNDIGNNGKVTYSIMGDEGQFRIDTSTGEIITTTSPLICHSRCERSSTIACQPNSCIITVVASDSGIPPLSGRAYVSINVKDENDHAPKMVINYRNGGTNFSTVNENAADGEIVAIVTVSDSDSGLYGNISSFSVTSGNELNHFRVSSKLEYKYNIIQVNGDQVLDRERKQMYNFTLKAVDRGSPPKSSVAHLVIYVNDVNDHKPEFQTNMYTASLSETVPEGTFVSNLIATDADSGLNAALTYEIVSGNVNSWFQIDISSGLVTTAALLDYSKASRTSLNVSVHDGGATPFYDYTTLIIDVWDENNMAPTFAKAYFNVSIGEGLPADSKLWVASAVDNDSGVNGTITYAFSSNVDEKYPGTFHLNSQSGEITTRKALDRETQSKYMLEIIARDGAARPLSSTATLYVEVEDKNDNIPYFYPQEYYANVDQESPIGTTVQVVSAFDADLGDNGRIYYSFTQSYPQFSISQDTGAITTTQILRKALKNSYTLLVTCRDTNTAHRAAQNAVVEISVTDATDVAPVFVSSSYSFITTEDSQDSPSFGRFVGKVKANGATSYAITAGDVKRIFTIDTNTGEIRTSKIVDREQQAVYSLTVTAKGLSKYSSTHVEISVTDINDNAPVFESTSVDVNVFEDWPVGMDVYHAEATDEDAGLNSALSYSMQSPTDLFQIRSTSGLIYLARNVEKTDGTFYVMNVKVRDSGPQQKTAAAQVRISILDVNDHTPTFPKHSYEISLNESILLNTQFYMLTATDTDSGKNAEITYNITRGNSEKKFGIFPDGHLFVAKELDRETQDLYKLTVMARDKGDNPRSSSVNITIHITDANDNRPLFLKTSYQFEVSENLAAGQKIGYIRALDADVGRNSELSYYLAQNSDSFAIDVQTGEITTLKSFDRELLLNETGRESYQFEAVVHDNGIPAQQDKASITVTVLDKNDNAPEFTKVIYKAYVSEDAAINSPVIKVKAVDLDKDENSAVTYQIIKGNNDGKFNIHPTNGEISLNDSIDMELQTSYSLVVMATDTGKSNTFSATAIVNIFLMDVNDNTPSFDQTSYSVRVPEDMAVGEEINIKMVATDTDLGVNAEISYALSGTGNDGTFKIDRHTGKLYLARKLNYEQKSEYRMNVVATDKGLPVLSSNAIITIDVDDVNDNHPVFVNLPNVVNISENNSQFSSVLQISASDSDSGSNGQVTYYVAVEDPPDKAFSIQNGNLLVQKSLDRESVPLYHLTIAATDIALPISSRKTVEKTIAVRVIDTNDNAPEFISPRAILLNYPTVQGKVGTIIARDPDDSNNGKVTYSLLSQTDNFNIGSGSGELFLTQNLPQSPSRITIRVRATDGGSTPKTTEADFAILLHQSTRTGPTFQNLPYTAQITENSATGSSVLRITASTQSVEYYISGIKSGDRDVAECFVIEKNSGIIRTKGTLDREELGGVLTITVSAVDVGNNEPAVSTTQVTVTILDQNDTPPKFNNNSYTEVLSEGISTGSEVLKLSVTDPDTQGGTTNIRITSGNEDNTFTVDNSGSIKIVRQLDRESHPQYRLKLEATDGQNTAQATVTFTVTDTNDNTPTFTQTFYSFNVPEDSPIGTILARVEAEDPDEGANGIVTYSMTSSWAQDIFELNPNTGVIVLANRVDFEQTHVYIVKVKAQDGGTPSKSSSVTVYLNVKDVNDNAPEFDPQSYNAEVMEDAVLGTSVLRVSATDVDSGMNGQIMYSIVDGDLYGQFGIGTNNGTVFTTKTLDRETMEIYNLTVMATDLAEPSGDGQTTITMVIINVRDVNDCNPVFNTPSFMHVRENTPVGTVAFTVQADDKDEGNSGKVAYSMATHPAFSIIPSTGEVKVKAQLDREMVQNYTLHVTATDQGTQPLSTSQTIVVHIEDENDNPPKFTQNSYFTTCPEDIEIGTSLLQVTATDRDSGLNGIVRFFIIEGDDNADFSMDPSSGVLRVQKQLDYERLQSYTITVRAEDSGQQPRYSSAKISINIIDVNDNKPVFIDSPFNAIVRENMDQLPVFVAQLSARDDDSPQYSRLTYGLRNGDSAIFRVNSTTGEITCHKSLDRETIAEYRLVVVAIDSGAIRLTGTGTVNVKVQDVNDNTPQFDRNSAYIGHVAENENVQTEILTVHATDADHGHNSEITYRLVDSLDGKFAIITNSGKILTQRSLDREEYDHYDLQVVAEDHGNLPRSAVANVTVYVDDVNDNSPKFERPSYHQTLNNPTLSGQFVIGVTALDRDVGSNGQVEYSLSGTDASKFGVDANRGIVKAKEQLSGSTYRCQITASDKGNPLKSSVVDLTVNFSSADAANNPSFTRVDTPVTVNESVSIGTTVSTVSASSTTGSTVRYYIAGGNINNAFEVDENSGIIRVAGLVDYEMTHDFHLWIQAKDSGNMFLAAYSEVVVNVNDLNDNTPRFDSNVYLVEIEEEVMIGTNVIQILATDADDGQNGRVGYVIADGNIGGAFNIDAVSGRIKTASRLDRENHQHYSLVIKATDQGEIPLTGSTTVRITLKDINDNEPKFSQIFSAQVPEDASVGSFVIQVTSSDADIGENARTNYSIVYSGGLEEKFQIDRASGNITLRSLLDAEELYKLTGKNIITIPINAHDGSFKIGGSVTIFVMDVNDGTPQLVGPTSFSIMEHSSIDTRVGRLNATDADITQPNNQVYFSLKLPSLDFHLDDQTGEITSKSELSYVHHKSMSNAMNQRELVVIVTDLGTPARSSESIITINILDANDHAPVFDLDNYYSAVPHNLAEGQEILQVNAVDDLDFGENAEIEYTIASGNGSAFFSVIPESGMVVVGKSLSGQIGQTYTLVIRASDKGSPPRSDTATVILIVTNVNQYPPQFTNSNFQVTIPENAAIGQSIAQLVASDSDGSGLNAEIKYFILGGNANNLFSINERQGIISVNKPLDFDTVPSHVLNVSARDSGLLYKETTALFTVKLSDVNDNPPVFDKDSYDAYISEGAGIGRTVFTIRATDADIGQNARIEYYFSDIEPSFKFIVNQNTGVITTKAPLDYETQNEYSILIIAQNPGNQQMKSSAKVVVHVTGINEYRPKFVLREYSFSTKESASNGTVIGSIQATDQDGGEDGVVYYYLVGSSNTKGFSVNFRTGEIYVSGKPDYESSPQVILTALAKNRGSIRGNDTDTCIVKINVQDANDPPEFSPAYYQAEVQENSGADVSIVTVTATDNDHNPNDKQFSYTILSGNDLDLFKVDSASGLVSTTGRRILDRETVPIYNLTVGAVDTGSPPATGSASVQIHLRDVNDNGPVFFPSDLTGSVLENQTAGTIVMNLADNTTDPDLPPNQGPYQYYVITDNTFFNIQADGVVKTKKALDRETTPMFNISVRVLDSGVPTMSSVLTFFVKVLDYNDSPPKPRNMDVQVALYGNGYPTSAIADVRPKDDDLVGSYTCSVNDGGQNLFYIPSACDLHIRNTPAPQSYPLTINGSDGTRSVLYTINANFIQVTDSALDNIVILQVSSIQAGTFMLTKFANFKTSLDNLDSSKVMTIFNIIDLSGSTDVLIYIGARDASGNIITHDTLKQLLLSKKSIVEGNSDILISKIGYSVCNQSSCNSGECLRHVSVGSGFGFLDSPNFVLSSPELVPDLKCNCPPQFSGSRCEIPVNPCGSGFCENGGTCLNNVRCDCPPGWEGDFCQTDKKECDALPCKNGATCQNTLGSYYCTCKDGFTGQNCETGSNNCASNPCRNGGVCRNELNGYTCNCPYIYWGEQCQFVSRGFEEGSYMEFPSLDILQSESSFDLTFATTMPNGLLLYNPSASVNTKDYIALEIVNSEVLFSFNLGDPTATRLRVRKNVTTGDWFKVEILRQSERASMKVRHCPSSRAVCDTCNDNDPSCYSQGSQQTNILNLDNNNLLIGGVKDISTIQRSQGQIQTHDFIGCIRHFEVNNEDKLTATPIQEYGVTDRCLRANSQGQCTPSFCMNGGVCVEEWSNVYCRCPSSFGGLQCEIELQPVSFGPGAYVTLVQRESYKRDQLVSGSSSRKRRSTSGSSIMVRFRPTTTTGLLMLAETSASKGILWVNEGSLTYSFVQNSGQAVSFAVDSRNVQLGQWQNATVNIEGQDISVLLETSEKTATSSEAFEFSDVSVTSVMLGGAESTVLIDGKNLKDFDGCISTLELDGSPLSLWNSTTDRFEIIRASKLPNRGCTQMCASCGNQACTPNGEFVTCSPAKQENTEESLSIGVIVVIAFFGVLLIVIGVIFVIFRMRRQRNLAKSDHNKNTKIQGNGHLNKSYTNSSPQSGQDSGYGDQDFMTQSNTVYNNGVPDLINQPRRSPMPYNIDGSTVIIENGDMPLGHLNDDMPEHYDIDAASSIAPSDIDVVMHYKDYRKGIKNDLNYHQRPPKHSSSSRTSRESPIGSQNWNGGSDPPPYGALKQQTAPHMRHSPANRLEVPNHRNSPNNYLGVRNSPINQLSRQSPQVRASPLTHSNLRGTPAVEVQHSRTDSEHSLASHHSRSSTSSSVPRTALPNGHMKHPRHHHHHHQREYFKPNSQQKGLTLEEIEKLNARPQRPSPVSMLEAVSSSSEGNHRHRNNHLNPDQMMLVPSDSSSDDSANDSFTCSEFEYENDKGGRGDFNPSAMIFSKLAEVDNENEDSNLSPKKIINSDGLDSNGGSYASTVGSSEGGENKDGKPINGQFNWDYLLNWGPSFEKLVGVFQDIASLPEGDEAVANSEITDNREEYV
ncbi:hypothetical protein FSP39_006219 [Pinctada imbricata]|uniref:Uncharacterized protein n=1 Tax=Pinctada imbricata TaxID=66713 RepID=A0AA88Y7V6_PINIB|nr:hypothetical protein FSP39_006219 [Pinctada imbricata]